MPRLLLLVASAMPHNRAEEARRLGIEAVRSLGSDDVLLLRKDAFSVEAAAQGFRRVAFLLEGGRFDNGIQNGVWYDAERHGQPGELMSWPISRDREMVKAAAKALKAGWQVSATILHDGERDVKVEHLINACKEFGIPGSLVVPAATKQKEVLDDPSWTDRDQVWIDLETTGLSPEQHAVVQIGAVHCDPHGRVVRREYKAMIKPWPGAIIDPYAMQVNKLSPESWKDAPDAREGLVRFLAWLPPRFVFCNQNVNFDRRHLQASFDRQMLPDPGWGPEKRDVCTKKMATRLLVRRGLIENAKLETMCSHLGVSNVGAHDALADAKRARQCFLAMVSQDTEATGTEG